MELQLETVELEKLIREVAASVEPLARNKGIALSVVPVGGITLVGDASKIKQMLLNLLSNAIKFTPHEGRIDIQSRQVGSSVEIDVRDTGIGIAEHDLGRLFRSSSSSRHGRGRCRREPALASRSPNGSQSCMGAASGRERCRPGQHVHFGAAAQCGPRSSLDHGPAHATRSRRS